ncbi:hypothetical protein QTP70_025980, partial [Hemibagrus guttatus]
MRGCRQSLLQGRRFHCREWALEKVKRYLEARNQAKGVQDSSHPPSGVLVMGGPGTGKTAFCTELVWPQSEAGRASGLASRCLAWHYCQREDADSLEVWRFVLGLVEQLRKSPLLAPSYGNLLANPAIATSLDPLHCQRDPDDTFKRAVLETLLSLPSPSQSLYIVVDSLDSGCGGTVGVSESLKTVNMATQSTSVAELLHRHHQYLPPWILLVCSARRQNKAVCKMFSDNGPSVGVHCVGKGRAIVRRALQREESVRALLDSGVNVNRTDPSDGRTLLSTAAYNGLADITALLLCRGADPSLSDNQGHTPLTLAARQGHVGVLQVMLDWIQDQECGTVRSLLEHADSEGWTALRSASWGGHKEAVKMLLEAGAEVDGCDPDGRTALRAAAWGGHEEILLTLLSHGATVDKMDNEGRTPLIAAAYMGQKEAVEILLDAGAEVDLADGDGRTALSVAALCVPSAAGGRGHVEVVSLLLERGADPEHKDNDGMTPLLLASYEGHEEVVELLLEAGADVDESAGTYPSAVTPLLAAAAMGHAGTVNRMLFWGAAVDGIDGEGRTALCLAAAKGSVEVVRALLDRGLDENHKDDLGWTPLHAAACEGHKSICTVLTEQASMARVGELDVEGRTPLILAAQEGHCSTVRLLLDRKSSIDHRGYNGHSALSAAALQGHGEVVELLLRRGADTDVRDAEGRPLLYLLILEGCLDIAALLIEKGGVPLESRDAEGRTALHVAAWQGDLDGIELLLRHGADPNALDSEGRPPLHSVAWRGHMGAGRLLLRARGINVNLACKKQGATTLSIAAQEGHTEIVAMLLENGAKPDLVDNYGRSPVKVAGKRGNFSIVHLLESYGAKPFLGHLTSLCDTPGFSHSSILKTQVSICSVEASGNGGPATSSTSSNSLSASCSPASTAERFHSVPGSQTSSSTCHSLATVQTVPADTISFTQQIQQHSLPRCRSRPSTLPLHDSNHSSLQRSTARNKQKAVSKDKPTHARCTVLGLQDLHVPLKGLGSPQTAEYSLNPHTLQLIENDLENSPLKFGS